MRNLVWMGAVAIIVAASGAVAGQKPNGPDPAAVVTVITERARVRLPLNTTSVLDRLLSFDANGDNRISHDELPERMEGVVSRGDRNQDGFLTPDEIVVLADSQPSVPRRPVRVNTRGSASLADIIADLKLPPATHKRALAIVNVPRGMEPANDFKTEMKALLNDEDYENYVAAVARLRSTPRIISGNIGGVIGGMPIPPPPPPSR